MSESKKETAQETLERLQKIAQETQTNLVNEQNKLNEQQKKVIGAYEQNRVDTANFTNAQLQYLQLVNMDLQKKLESRKDNV